MITDNEGNVIPNANITVFELDDSTGESYLRKRFQSDVDGNLKFRLDPNGKYIVKTEKDGYFTTDREISTMGMMSSRKTNLDLSMEKITKKAFVLENIYYDFNASDLSDEARATLDTTIYEILVENPTIVVEIGSHTDSKGRSEYNKALSQQRAESVVKYLIKRGIRRDRLTAKGYGETQPVAPNKFDDGSDNPDGRAKNRRTEFRVIGEIELIEED